MMNPLLEKESFIKLSPEKDSCLMKEQYNGHIEKTSLLKDSCLLKERCNGHTEDSSLLKEQCNGHTEEDSCLTKEQQCNGHTENSCLMKEQQCNGRICAVSPPSCQSQQQAAGGNMNSNEVNGGTNVRHQCDKDPVSSNHIMINFADPRDQIKQNNDGKEKREYTNKKKKIVDWKDKQLSLESQQSMDEAVRRITEKWSQEKMKMRKERERRERLNNIYTLLAVVLIVLLAVAIVTIRILCVSAPEFGAPPQKPEVQWMMDWYIDQPGAVSKPRAVPVKWESLYNLDYWLYHRKRE